MKKGSMKNISDLQSHLSTHPAPSRAIVLQMAINYAINKKGLKESDALTDSSFEMIESAINDLNDPSCKDAEPIAESLKSTLSALSPAPSP